MKKPLLLIDFYKTLCYTHYWQSIPLHHKPKQLKIIFSGGKKILDEWMRGEYTSEEINRYVSKKTGLSYEYLWEHFVFSCKNMKIQQETLHKINQLRDSYTVVLMTDNTDCFDRFIVPSFDLDSYFDYISNSYNVGLLKQDNNGEIFSKVLSKYDVEFKDAILIDDTKKICKLFEKLGGTSYNITHFRKLPGYLKKLS